MKLSVVLYMLMLFPVFTYAQEEPEQLPKKYAKPNYIRSGFYLKFGPVFPTGVFATGQNVKNPFPEPVTWFDAARIGGDLSMGYLIYIGPGIANNYLRFGIDAGFLDGWFATSQPTIPYGSDKSETEFWYYFISQKFGPVVTVNPVDRLMIDLSYKLTANVSWHDSDWGAGLLGQEVMMNIRYRVFLLSFIYNTGSVNYNDYDNSRPDHSIDISTFRFLIGFKF